MNMELLAPAGSYNILKIGINRGADAIYLAGKKFGARAYAENFTLEEIEKSVKYAHLNNTKIFVTVNTLINNFEIMDLLKYIFRLYKIGVDAIIIQDFGVLKLINSIFPKMKIHTSTQMPLNNYYNILWATKQGVSRVIFPRELSIDEIHDIHMKLEKENIDLELEVFSHGAICYSISGNCYLSSVNNGRSGNRGACTQPCRREYALKYKGHNIDKGYLLSTHDLNVSNDLKKLDNAGIDSIKLEGRMKSEDYVGTIVNSYRNLLDNNEGSFKEDLNMVFNREFTNGYLLNQTPGNVMGRKRSGYLGSYIGKIIEIINEEEIINKDTKYSKREKDNWMNKTNKRNQNNNSHINKHSKFFEAKESTEIIRTMKKIKISKENPIEIIKGDGIAFKIGKTIKGIYVEEVLEQNEEYLIINTSRNIRVGDEVFISYSQAINKDLRKYKSEKIQPQIPISLDIKLDDNLCFNVKSRFYLNGTKLEFDYKSKTAFEKAIKRPISIEEVKKQLSKTGGTSFFIDKLNINNFPDDIFIPISKLNEIRRGILERATKILLNYYKPDKTQIKQTKNELKKFIKEYNSRDNVNHVDSKKSKDLKYFLKESKNLKKITNNSIEVSVFVDNLNLIEAASIYPVKKIYFDPSYLYNNPDDYFNNIASLLESGTKKLFGNELVWVLPSFISDDEIDKSVAIFNDLKSKGINISIMTDDVGIGDLFDTKVYGNHNLNIWNSFACENLNDNGFDSLILSSELSYKEIKELKRKIKSDVDLEFIVHGNLEVMVSKDDFSNLNNGKDLIINDNSEYAVLEDKKRKKFKYKILFDFNKKSHFRNKDCLCLIDESERIKALGLDSIILDCRFSNEYYTSKIISLYLEGLENTNKKDLYKLKKQIQTLTHSYLSKYNFLEGRIHEND